MRRDKRRLSPTRGSSGKTRRPVLVPFCYDANGSPREKNKKKMTRVVSIKRSGTDRMERGNSINNKIGLRIHQGDKNERERQTDIERPAVEVHLCA